MTMQIWNHAYDLFESDGPDVMWTYLGRLIQLGIISEGDAVACANDIASTAI